eukprot:FR737741.1.p3 GENE.FR737741.1~~FR737741.1.p3  ORF type:complete len:112 (-),score=30.11 FR737741.1:39-374(-)
MRQDFRTGSSECSWANPVKLQIGSCSSSSPRTVFRGGGFKGNPRGGRGFPSGRPRAPGRFKGSLFIMEATRGQWGVFRGVLLVLGGGVSLFPRGGTPLWIFPHGPPSHFGG